MIRILIILLVCLSTNVRAQITLGDSVRPLARPIPTVSDTGSIERQRPAPAEPSIAVRPFSVVKSVRPKYRTTSVETAARAFRQALLRGQICGDPALQGKAIGDVSGKGACGIENAVQVRSVAGVTLKPAAKLDCRTAKALKKWVNNGAKPAVGSHGGGIASLRIVSHYACRNRNSAKSGRLSEHSFGRAIDIAGIKLKSGREISVLKGWNTKADGKRLRAMWRKACGPFGTVLGPNANAAHRDHFHFDTARYRSGSYCR